MIGGLAHWQLKHQAVLVQLLTSSGLSTDLLDLWGNSKCVYSEVNHINFSGDCFQVSRLRTAGLMYLNTVTHNGC